MMPKRRRSRLVMGCGEVLMSRLISPMLRGAVPAVVRPRRHGATQPGVRR